MMSFVILFFLGFLFCFINGENCIERKEWEQYNQYPFTKKCPNFPNKYPRFDKPVDCLTREVIKDLAYSISNDAFLCDKWCVFSLTQKIAWIWVPTSQCFEENKNCFNFPNEVAHMVDVSQSLCPTITNNSNKNDECIHIIHNRELSISTIKKKCPNHHSQAKPAFHEPTNCETGYQDAELTQALVNGAFSSCKNWCVYSLINPNEIAWFWDPSRDCWTGNNTCHKIEKEKQFAIELKSKLCESPCAQPRKIEEISVELFTKKCENYSEDFNPQFHQATICDTSPVQTNQELQFALANFAFSACKNWCVYSLERPFDLAWIWVPNKKCWTESKWCLSLEVEIKYAIKLQQALCIPPTANVINSRKIQRPTPTVEDTGLWGDQKTQQDAIEMYKLFGGILLTSIVLLIIMQFLFPPESEELMREKELQEKKKQ